MCFKVWALLEQYWNPLGPSWDLLRALPAFEEGAPEWAQPLTQLENNAVPNAEAVCASFDVEPSFGDMLEPSWRPLRALPGLQEGPKRA